MNSGEQERIYKIEGMTCASCSQVIEDNVKKMPHVKSIEVNFAAEKAYLKVASSKFDETAFFSLLQKLGYRALDPNSQDISDSKKKIFLPLSQAAIGILGGSLLMFMSMAPQILNLSHRQNNNIQLVIASLFLLFFGKKYLLSVFQFFKTAQSNMNTLIGLGLLSAYIYSLSLMIFVEHAHVYFETIPFILGFTILGHFFEEQAKTKARSSLSSLYKMQIKFANKISNGHEISTPVIELNIGDIIRLKPGDKIPLDGIVIDGDSHADESMITGESQAVFKKNGEKVYAGSLNLDGTLLIKIEQVLHQTFISDVVAYVEKAQLKKAPIQKYADKVVRYFVPVIIIISLISFAAWWYFSPEKNDRMYLALTHMITILLIACPCALGLAVPMTVMLSTSEASKIGLLIGGGEYLEKASTIDTVVFDKTGTLTSGHPEVIEFKLDLSLLRDSAFNEEALLQLIGSAAQFSNHPLSQAISRFVEAKNIPFLDPDTFKNKPGLGFSSTVKNHELLVGNATLLKAENIFVPKVSAVGSHVYISMDHKFCGHFVIADPIKPLAQKTITHLEKSGIEVWMLTGDNIEVAQSIARELGIKNVMANVLPVEKADFILKLKTQGKKVAMVGDGINDAPALTSADLALAMSSGSDIAIEAANVSILEGKIELIYIFFNLSHKTMRIIKQNLFLSFIYNVLCIPLAAGVFYPWFHLSLNPMWASLAMGLSSTSVVLSSLRLKHRL